MLAVAKAKWSMPMRFVPKNSPIDHDWNDILEARIRCTLRHFLLLNGLTVRDETPTFVLRQIVRGFKLVAKWEA